MQLGCVLSLFTCCLTACASAEMNVYGKPLVDCGTGSPGSGVGNQCTYRQYDAGAHQVCVKHLPHGFSSKTGQGPWSNTYTNQPWCICIWAYSNYVLNHGDSDLPVQCDALPDKVLESEFALKSFKRCGSMASPCSSYNEAIAKMCKHCSDTAPDDEGRTVLQSKCKEILGPVSDL